jgi:hypothetical protein
VSVSPYTSETTKKRHRKYYFLCNIIHYLNEYSIKMDDAVVMNSLRQFFELCDNLTGLSLVLAVAVMLQFVQSVRKKRQANRHRNREYALNEMEAMSEKHFKRMFRMSKRTFNVLEEKLLDLWGADVDEEQAARSSGSHITFRTRLACTLRWMAGGSYLDICFEFGVAPGSFFSDGGVLWGTMDLINESFEIGFPFDNDAKLRKIADDFAYYSKNKMNNCVLAIDGWVCRTRCPNLNEVQYPMAYRNRHGCFGIVILAGCDANLRFHMFSSVSGGSTNDIMAWQFCAMKSLLDNNRLPEPYYFIGDEAFICTNQFLVPWSGRGLPLGKDSFNYHLSSMRQCIERAFAILTNRWGIFWRPLHCAYERWTLVCMVAAKLHNFCIDMDDSQPQGRHAADHQDQDAPIVYMNNEEDDVDGNLNQRPIGHKRAQISAALDRDKIYRPSL